MYLQVIPGVYPAALVPTAVVPVPAAEAWMLILGLLAVSCAILWLLGNPGISSAARWVRKESARRGRTRTRRPLRVVTQRT